MRIKHSKYKNTGLIFELLVKQITADTLTGKDSPAVEVLKKYYTGKGPMAREFKLYEFVTKNRYISQNKAEAIISSITEVSRKLDRKALKSQKYSLIAELKEHYDLDEFFGIQVPEYKPLAAVYCLLEAHNTGEVIEPKSLVGNKMTILEYLTANPQSEEEVKDNIIEEFSKYSKDLRLLAFKILLEKFNDKYKDLLPEQKRILREFITSVDSTARLRNLVNEELSNIRKKVVTLSEQVQDRILKIKIQTISKDIKPLGKADRVDDSHLTSLMQYYDLVNELEQL